MVSIITVNYNQTELTCALLESIRRQDYLAVETIVVDNASDENPASVLLTRFPNVKFIRSEKNLGFAGGNNLALPEATGDYLFFVNNDAEIADGCIKMLVDFLEKTPKAGIVSPLICYHPDQDETLDGEQGNVAVALNAKNATIQYAGMPRVNPFTSRSNMDGNGEKNTGQYKKPFQTGYAHGAAMMVARPVLEQIGPMSEDYFLYYEEVDWCERMLKANLEVWVEPRALVWHKESMTMESLGAAKTFYLTRNRIHFMKQHYGGWKFGVFTLFLTFVTIPKNLVLYAIKGEWANMKAFLKGVFAP